MKQRKSEINWKLVVRVACLMLLDVMLLYLACLLALLSRFDLSIHTLMRDSGFLPALHICKTKSRRPSGLRKTSE